MKLVQRQKHYAVINTTIDLEEQGTKTPQRVCDKFVIESKGRNGMDRKDSNRWNRYFN